MDDFDCTILVAFPNRDGIDLSEAEPSGYQGNSARTSRDNKSLLQEIFDYLSKSAKPLDCSEENIHCYLLQKDDKAINIILATSCDAIYQRILHSYDVESHCIVIDYKNNCFNKVFYEDLLNDLRTNAKILPICSAGESMSTELKNKNVIKMPIPYQQVDFNFILREVINNLFPPEVRIIIPSHLDDHKDSIGEKVEEYLFFFGLDFTFQVISDSGPQPKTLLKQGRFFNIVHLDSQELDTSYPVAISMLDPRSSIFTCFGVGGVSCEVAAVRSKYNGTKGGRSINAIFEDPHYYILDTEFWLEFYKKIKRSHGVPKPIDNDKSSMLRSELKKINEPSSEDTKMNASYDVFISHASEDKEAIARPIYQSLKKLGVSPFYDEVQIEWGEGPAKKVGAAMASSSFILAIISSHYLNKPWPETELQAALNKDASHGTETILPLMVGETELLGEHFLLKGKRYETWAGDPDQIAKLIQQRIK